MFLLVLVLHFLLIIPPALTVCEPWCSSPCTVLNGNPATECSSCPPTTACNPASDGFSATAKPKQRPVRRRAPEQRNTQEIDETSELLERLRAAARSRPAAMTAGSEDVECDILRVTVRELLELDQSDREYVMTTVPLLIEGLIDDWKAHGAYREDPFAFAQAYGHHEIFAKRSHFGHVRMDHNPGCDYEQATQRLEEVLAQAGQHDSRYSDQVARHSRSTK